MPSARRFTIQPDKHFYLYDTPGDWQGTVMNWFIFDPRGDYLGFIQADTPTTYDVYTTSGEWIGEIIQDGRIVRKRNYNRKPLLKELPPKPPKPAKLPARAPLPPQTSDLGFDKVDVLEWDPDVFKRLSDLIPDAGEE
jgi:hypothetical protein